MKSVNLNVLTNIMVRRVKEIISDETGDRKRGEGGADASQLIEVCVCVRSEGLHVCVCI